MRSEEEETDTFVERGGESATILVSPHPDDVAYSVGGSLLTSFFQGPKLILSAFTRSNFAPYSAGAHDTDTISRIRREEDMKFAQRTGSTCTWLNLPTSALVSDSGTGGFPLLSASTVLFGWPVQRGPLTFAVGRMGSAVPLRLKYNLLMASARFDNRYTILRASVLNLVSKYHDAILVSPLGLGNHPDHMIASVACRSLRNRAARVYFYEDLPYATEYSMNGIARYVRALDSRLRQVKVDISGVMEEKIRNLSGYGSQVGPREVIQTREYARRLGQGGEYERLWTY